MIVYSVIPARGGSKSIPKKNIQLLGGKALIEYSIEYSIKSAEISRTIVSTDSNEIAKIAKNAGADVPFIRPDELAHDDTQDYPVFRHALEKLELIYEVQIDVIALLRPTSPLRPEGLLEKGLDLLNRYPDASSVRTVTPSQEHPFRQWIISEEYIKGYQSGFIEPYNLPRQNLPSVYFQTGDLELIRRQTILDGSISGDFILPLIIDAEDMLDIDHPADLRRAEQKKN